MSNMTQPGYDERHAMPIEASRRGAHRARPNPLLGVLPIAGVAVVVAAVVVLAYALFGSSLGGSNSANTAPITDPTGGTSVAASPAASAVGQAGASTGADGGQSPQTQPSQDASPQASEPAATGKVDKTIVLNFYNATEPVVQGLSRKAAAALVGQGWKQGAVATWTGVPVTQTTVFYNKASQKATAQAIVDALGVGVVKQAQKPQKQILVVVSNDYPG